MLNMAFSLWVMSSTATSSSLPTTVGTLETLCATTTTPTSAPSTRTMTNAWMTALLGARVNIESKPRTIQAVTYSRYCRYMCKVYLTVSLILFLHLFPGGYWYNCCTDSNLNGVYYRYGEHTKSSDGITWYGWHGSNYSLKKVEMKVRPVDFQP